MRKGRIALAIMVALLAVLVGCIWVLPRMLDWNQYRDSIAALATSGLGRPVRIAGAVTLELLPEPILTASELAVDDTGDGVVLTAQELRLRVALGPLLAGQVDARDLTLRGADLRLPWPPASGALAQRPPAWLTGLQARVEDSRIVVGGLAISAMTAVLSTDPETGTLSATGTGRLGVGAWRFTIRLGRPGRDGGAVLDASLDGDGPLRDTGGTFSGQVGGDGALSGRVAGRGADLSQLLPAPAVPWRSEGRLSAAGGLAVADELVMEIGGSPARGAVALRVTPEARLDLALAAGRLDLDAWVPVLLRGAAVGMPTGIDLSAEAATLAGGTVRRLRGAFDLDADGVTVRDTTGLLPGDAQLTLSGRIPARTRSGVTPEFEGAARIVAPDLRATLRWLEPLAPAAFGPAPLATLPPGVLRTADMAARVTVGVGQASVSDLAGALDSSRVTGGLAVKLGPRLSIGAGLSFERLALDPWTPDLPALVAAGDGLLTRMHALDADVKLDVRQGTWRGLPVGPITFDAQTEATRLTLRRLEATVQDMRLTASATVGEGGRSEGRIELNAPDIAPLRGLLPAEWIGPAANLLRGPANATLLLSGPPDALAIRLTAEASDLRVDAQPTLNLSAQRWSGSITLHHPGAPRLLDTLGMGSMGAWLGDGSLSLLSQVVAVPGRLAFDSFDLAAGTLRARGQLAVSGRSVTGQVAAEVLPLPSVGLRSPEPLPLRLLAGWDGSVRLQAESVLLGQAPLLQDLAADVAVQNGTLRIERASARLDGGAVSGSIMLDTAREPPALTVQGTASGVAVSAPMLETAVDVVSGVLDATMDLQASGHSPATLLATLSGPVTATIRDGVLRGLDLAAAGAALRNADATEVLAGARAALLSGATPMERLDLRIQASRGVLTPEGALSGPAGDAAVTGSVDVPGASAELRLLLRPTAPDLAQGPELGLRLTGPLRALVRTPELAGLSRWLADRL